MKQYILLAGLSLSITACAGSSARYVPIVDGPQNAQFQADLAACQSVAQQKKFNNGDVRTEALVGAVFGAVAGAVEDSSDAVGGAIVGAAFGGGERAWEVRGERKNIVINCLTNRGHNVVG